MAIVDLTVSPREKTGKNSNRRLRATGQFPGVIYGHGEPQKIAVDARTFDRTLQVGDGERSILRLQGVGEDGDTVIIRDVQRDPVYHRKIVHVDFGRVRMDEIVSFTIPVHTTGLAPGVKLGGILAQPVRMLDVLCTPADVPTEIIVDISALEIGMAIYVKDLDIPEGVTPTIPLDDLVVQVSLPRAADEEEEEAEGEGEGEGEEGAEPEVIGKGKSEDDEESSNS